MSTASHQTPAPRPSRPARSSLRPCPSACQSATRPALERGQATTEYALVLLGVAAVAMLLAAWVAHSGKLTSLFDLVVDQLISHVH